MIKVKRLPLKPILLYDGECDFCCNWAAKWKNLTNNKVHYIPYQQCIVTFPELSIDTLAGSIHLIDRGGLVYSRACAVFRILNYSKRHRWLLKLYNQSNSFAKVADHIYELVSKHRSKPLVRKGFNFIFGLILG